MQNSKGIFFQNVANVKFIYSEKATKFCEISTLPLTGTTEDKSKEETGDFAKFCDLLRIYELYKRFKKATYCMSLVYAGFFLLEP